MCPAVGISTTVMNGIMLGIAVLFVQVFSSCTIALIKDYIHPRIRIPTYTLTIATWVTVIDLVLAAYMPVAYKEMGIFVKLIVAFAIITMRLEVFACKNSVPASFWDGNRVCERALRNGDYSWVRRFRVPSSPFLCSPGRRILLRRHYDGNVQLYGAGL